LYKGGAAMINTKMRLYNYYTFGSSDGYGMPQLSTEPDGQIKISINISSQSTQDSILFKDCSYVGLTHDNNINDSYVIDYNGAKLKVLYVNPGRFKQVYLKEM
jgi:hypothetical protein